MTALSSPPPVPDDSHTTDIESLWRATQERLAKSVPESTYRLWLEPLEAVGADADTIYLKAPEGIRAWAERRYSALIDAALAEMGTNLQQVSFATPREADEATAPGPELNPSYTFERFVMGLGDRQRGTVGEAVAGADDEALEGVVGVQLGVVFGSAPELGWLGEADLLKRGAAGP